MYFNNQYFQVLTIYTYISSYLSDNIYSRVKFRLYTCIFFGLLFTIDSIYLFCLPKDIICQLIDIAPSISPLRDETYTL